MFAATAINFILSSLVTGTQVAIFIAPIRKALILDVDYPLLEKLELAKVVWNLDIAIGWVGSTTVSTSLSLLDSVSNNLYSVKILLSDLVVIWRAWALFQDQQWIILLPFILWFGAAGEWTFVWESFPCAESSHSQGRRSPAAHGQ